MFMRKWLQKSFLKKHNNDRGEEKENKKERVER